MHPCSRMPFAREQSASEATSSIVCSPAHGKLAIIVLLCMSLFNLQSTWYLTSISQQLHERTWREPAEQLVTIFNIALPLGSVVGALGSLLLCKRVGNGSNLFVVSVSLACITAMCIAISYTALPVLPPHPTISIVTSVLLFGPTRSFVWTTYYAFARGLDYRSITTSWRQIGCGNLVRCYPVMMSLSLPHLAVVLS